LRSIRTSFRALLLLRRLVNFGVPILLLLLLNFLPGLFRRRECGCLIVGRGRRGRCHRSLNRLLNRRRRRLIRLVRLVRLFFLGLSHKQVFIFPIPGPLTFSFICFDVRRLVFGIVYIARFGCKLLLLLLPLPLPLSRQVFNLILSLSLPSTGALSGRKFDGGLLINRTEQIFIFSTF